MRVGNRQPIGKVPVAYREGLIFNPKGCFFSSEATKIQVQQYFLFSNKTKHLHYLIADYHTDSYPPVPTQKINLFGESQTGLLSYFLTDPEIAIVKRIKESFRQFLYKMTCNTPYLESGN